MGKSVKDIVDKAVEALEAAVETAACGPDVRKVYGWNAVEIDHASMTVGMNEYLVSRVLESISFDIDIVKDTLILVYL